MLASLNLQTRGPTAADAMAVQIPPSVCRSAAIEGGRLLLDGRVAFDTVDGPLQTDYTLRMAVNVKREPLSEAGSTWRDGRPALRSTILWEEPEMRLSLGETGLVGLLPKLWVPVAPASGLELPPCVDLQRASASETADGLVFTGLLNLQPLSADGAPGRGAPPPSGRGWSDEERAALRLPPSR